MWKALKMKILLALLSFGGCVLYSSHIFQLVRQPPYFDTSGQPYPADQVKGWQYVRVVFQLVCHPYDPELTPGGSSEVNLYSRFLFLNLL
jgi:hypothetical protein